MTPPEEPKEALLDADSLVYSTCFSAKEKTVEEAKSRLTEWITNIVYFDLQCDDYKGYITGRGNFRNEIAVTHPYKGHRKDKEKPPHFQELREHIQRLGCVVTEGQEADDAVGIDSTVGNYWIVHIDKDLDQLPGWHYNPNKCIKYFVEPFEGLKNFYMQVLTGDSTDNIKGLWKVGPVKAAKYLEGLTTEQELYEACCKAYSEKKEPHERLIENARLLWLRRTPGELWSPPTKGEQ